MSFRRLSANAVASASYVVCSALLLFELYRFLAREIGASHIGVWALVTASSAVVRVSEFGISAGVVRFVAADLGEQQPERAAATAGMALAAVAVFMGLTALVLHPLLEFVVTSTIRDVEAAAIGLGLLPWAIGSLWLTTVTNVFVGVLDGQQRTVLRSVGMLFANLVQLGLAYALVPRDGLVAMGPVQFGFSLTGLIVLGLLAKFSLRQPMTSWVRWERGRFLDLVRYGGAFQVVSLSQVLFEPTTKWFLGVYGGLEASGYFEMANRALSQLRQVIVAGLQMLIPYVANRTGQQAPDVGAMRTIYVNAFRTLAWLAVPYFAMIGCLLPLVLTLWLGRYSALFIQIGLACLIGWSLNLLAAPAYAMFVAIGRLKWAMVSQIAMGLLNVVLCALGGYTFGALGVVCGAMAALALGSAFLLVPFHDEFGVRLSGLLPRSLPVALPVACAGVAASAWLGAGFSNSWSVLETYGASVLATACLLGVVAWLDPVRSTLLERLRNR
ncbi:MAG: lipopolysaccharide biosynthesis protein [Lautropia sp.]